VQRVQPVCRQPSAKPGIDFGHPEADAACLGLARRRKRRPGPESGRERQVIRHMFTLCSIFRRVESNLRPRAGALHSGLPKLLHRAQKRFYLGHARPFLRKERLAKPFKDRPFC
jgi:hypothetical protein